MKYVEELTWRGMIHDIMPETEETLNKGKAVGYIGFDPTATSLHIGSMVPIMLLVHFQRCGHKPIALVGGATGMIGDPSFKGEERKLLDEDTLRKNLEGIRKQLEKFLDFDCGENSAEIVNNYDWFEKMDLLGFLRDTGKHLTVNYMMAKDSVKNRLETGLSFTEFSYQLIQAYDFLWLNQNKNCVIQMGGSDQWGNITAGTELIRRKAGGEAYALTCPLITKADGSKFGKSEEGNVWLDTEMTSPYKFYQFWLNCSDEEASKLIRFFTIKTKEEIEAIEKEHNEAPHTRALQKSLAEDITIRTHSKEKYETAVKATDILFGKGTTETLQELDENMLLSIFEGVPQVEVARSEYDNIESVTDLLSEKTNAVIFNSKGEARKMIQGGGVSINKTKISDPHQKIEFDLLQSKYLLAQKGKKNYYLIKVV
ncbi:tyrosine--tRNA ligase [Cytophagaceae bacterium AH-315-L13]|nr:tyrosine--tRNA ligase [Cytophagaceae bacterium AH-315-L13]